MAFLNFPLLLPAAVSSAAVTSAVLETSVDEVALSSSTAHAHQNEEDDDIPEDWKAENHRFEEVKRCVQVVATSSGSEREDEEEEEKVVAEEQMGQVGKEILH